jgi:hypothetical protein
MADYKKGIIHCGHCGADIKFREVSGDNVICLVTEEEIYTCSCGAVHHVMPNKAWYEKEDEGEE